MTSITRSIHLGLSLLSMLLVACSGNDEGATPQTPVITATEAPSMTESPTAAPTPTLEDRFEAGLAALSSDDLAPLILPPRQFGSLGGQWYTTERTGPLDNVDAASQFVRLGIDAEELEAQGRLGGYVLAFEQPDLGVGNGGPFSIEVGIDLFENAAGAAAYYQLMLAESTISSDDAGIHVESAESFQVFAHGDEQAGQELSVQNQRWEENFQVTSAIARHGRLILWVGVAEFDTFDRRVFTESLLLAFEQRIQRSLGGEIEAIIEHTEPLSFDDRTVPPPIGAPDLEATTLSLADLSPGTRVTDEGYVASSGLLASYSRIFYTAGAWLLGSSRLMQLTTGSVLLPDEQAASAFMTSRWDQFGSADGPANFEQSYEALTGLKTQDTTIELVSLPYGDETVLVLITTVIPRFGQQTLAQVFVQTGAVISSAITVGPSHPAMRDDLLTLAHATGERAVLGTAASE